MIGDRNAVGDTKEPERYARAAVSEVILRERAISILLLTNVIGLGALSAVLLTAFGPSRTTKFTEINVERINILGPSGKPVIVLSNRERMPGPSMDGKTYARSVSEGRELLSGMLFFNDRGDEVGGLLFNGFQKGAGATDYGALGHLSFDQWRQNQVIALQYNDHGTRRRAGLIVWDRPIDIPMAEELDRATKMQTATTEAERAVLRRQIAEARAKGAFGEQRVFVGSEDQTALVQLSDVKGRVRARMYVGVDNQPHLDFLREDGSVEATYPPSSRQE